ncbi:MAG: hypothetical protein AAGI34_19880 [Pseudomonadota bacterium]
MSAASEVIADRHAVREARRRNPGTLCRTGMVDWCRANGLDYATLMSPGYPVSVLRATGDPLALPVIKAAERRAAKGDRHG